MERPVNVYIVDDQPWFRAAAGDVIAAADDFELVGEAADGEELVGPHTTLDLGTIDLVLMDINLGVRSGIEITRELTARPDAPRVLLMSTYSADDLPEDARDCGAIGYLSKSRFGPDSLQEFWDVGVAARASG